LTVSRRIQHATMEQQLKIKTGVLKRTVKEFQVYTDEVGKIGADLENMPVDHDKYRQTSQILEESKAMLLDTRNRVSDAKEDLENLLEEAGITPSEEVQDLLDKASKVN